MPTAFKLAHGWESTSANINLLGKSGTVQRKHCNYPLTSAFEVVSPSFSLCGSTQACAFTHQLPCQIIFHSLLVSFSCAVATKETSFLHAISAAGVMYTLTKNCSMGDFENCGCDDSRIGQAGALQC